MERLSAAIQRESLSIISDKLATAEELDAAFRKTYNATTGPIPAQPSDHDSRRSTRLIYLNIGLAEPLDDKLSMDDVMHRGSIMSFHPHTLTPPAALITHEAMPDGIDVHGARIYWTDMGTPSANDGAVYTAALPSSSSSPSSGTAVDSSPAITALVPRGGTHTPKQLICVPDDGVSGRPMAYWCDREGGRVMRVPLDGSRAPETVFQTGDWRQREKEGASLAPTEWCVGVAVSRRLGKVFWSQKGPSKGMQGRIRCARLDDGAAGGEGGVETVLEGLPEPIDLELDDEAGVLYWTDRGDPPLGNTLNKKTLVGETPEAERNLGRQILAHGFSEAIGLKLDKANDCMWVTDFGGHIWKCNPHKPALKQKVFESETGAFTGLALIEG